MDKLVNLIPVDILIAAVVAYILPTLLQVKAKAEETELEVAKTYTIAKALVVTAVEYISDGKLSDDEKLELNKMLQEAVESAKEVLK